MPAKTVVRTASSFNRQRISINKGWHFYKYDSVAKADKLIYDVRPEVSGSNEYKVADAKPTEAVEVKVNQEVLKPWILPSANGFINDPEKRHVRPTGNPGGNFPFVQVGFDDNSWEKVDLPHDWAIKGPFMTGSNPEVGGGMGRLPSYGVAWYRKKLDIPVSDAGKSIFLDVDGAMSYAIVWLNGKLVGGWPYGYNSWRLDLTPYLVPGGKNQLAIRLDNPNNSARWYPGGGIYRNVWLVTTNPVHVDQWGTYVTTPNINADSAEVAIQTTIKNDESKQKTVRVEQSLYDANGKLVSTVFGYLYVGANRAHQYLQKLVVKKPTLWNIENPYLYKLVTRTYAVGRLTDEYSTNVGIRSFTFDVKKGFILNGKRVKINGVCNHHDLGALGAAVNTRAIERQLQILKEMGCNGIRTSHNPPAPELLDLCDKMGFIVMDEAFDMWLKKKTTHDYSKDFAEWHMRDLTDMITRDRNHPSIFIWSIGNEVAEQWGEDKSLENMDLQQANVLLNNRTTNNAEEAVNGTMGKYALLTKHLVDVTKVVDPTRPVSAACNGTDANNPLLKSEALDLIGFN